MESSYNLRDVVNWLLSNGYGLLVSNQFVVTSKLNSELFNREEIVIQPIDVFTDKKTMWNQFVMNAEIPHRVQSSIGTYTVRQYNLAAAKKLEKILNDPSIDQNMFIASAKNYYKSVSGRTTLSKYLLSDLWKDDYDEWIKNPVEIVKDGSTRWED